MKASFFGWILLIKGAVADGWDLGRGLGASFSRLKQLVPMV